MRSAGQPNPQLFWWENAECQNSRAWLVVDPPDGRIPPQTPEAQQRAAARADARRAAAAARPIRYEDRSLTTNASRAACPGR